MIKLENTQVVGLEAAIRGMRNPMNSWEKSDSKFAEMNCDHIHDIPGKNWWFGELEGDAEIGPNDYDLMLRLAKQGPVHGKFRRMIAVYVDITAPQCTKFTLKSLRWMTSAMSIYSGYLMKTIMTVGLMTKIEFQTWNRLRFSTLPLKCSTKLERFIWNIRKRRGAVASSLRITLRNTGGR